MIIPTIQTNSKEDLVQKLDKTAQFSNRVSIDLVDQSFAESVTLQAEDFGDIDWKGLKVEVQLMVDEPEKYVSRLPLETIERVYGQVEHMRDMQVFFDECKLHGVSPGLGYDLVTSVNDLDKDLFEEVDSILLMSVPAGKSGQTFDVQVLEKVTILRARGFEGDIVVDGGMNQETIPLALEVGANLFCVNSAIWKSDKPAVAFKQLMDLLPHEQE